MQEHTEPSRHHLSGAALNGDADEVRLSKHE